MFVLGFFFLARESLKAKRRRLQETESLIDQELFLKAGVELDHVSAL